MEPTYPNPPPGIARLRTRTRYRSRSLWFDMSCPATTGVGVFISLEEENGEGREGLGFVSMLAGGFPGKKKKKKN